MLGLFAIAAGIFLSLALAYLGLDATGRATLERRLKSIKSRNMVDRPSLEGELRKLALMRTKPGDSFLARFIPKRSALEDRLHRSGKNWTVEQYAMGTLGLFVGSVVLLSMFRLGMLAALLAAIAVALIVPYAALGWLISARLRRFIHGFPVAIDLMARGIKSGLPISQTMAVIAAELEGPVREEFQSVSDAIRIGRTLDEGLNQVAVRIALPEFRFFCVALSVQRETGGNVGETLSNLSEVLRKRSQMKSKVKAISSEARTTSIIMAALPPLIIGAIHVLNPDYINLFLTNERLQMVGFGAFIWMIIGVVILMKMSNFKM